MAVSQVDGYLHNLTEEQTTSLAEFQALATDVIEETKTTTCWGVDLTKLGDPRDMVLLKFLRAVSFDKEQGKERLKATLEFRRDCKIDELAAMPLPSLFQGHDFNVGVDRNGNPISGSMFSKMDLEKIFAEEESFIRYRLYIMEHVIKRIAWKRGETECICSIHDYRGVPIMFRPPELKSCIKEISKIMADHYPEFKAKSIFCNFPKTVSSLWSAFSVFVPATTRAKMAFLGEDDFSSLFEIVAPEHLPFAMGGFGPWAEQGKDLSLTESTFHSVSSWSSVDVDGPTGDLVGKTVAYQIRVLDGDLEWKIQTADENGEVVENLAEKIEPRLLVEDGSIQGTVAITKPGKLRLQLINNFAYLWSKTVICRLTVL